MSSANTIENYYNYGHREPRLLLDSNPTVGLSKIVVTKSPGLLTCSFTRENSRPDVSYYFSSNKVYYILAAYGPLDGQGN
jgi:hypothetical protein